MDEARGTRRHEDEQNDRGQDGRAGCQGVVAQDVLEVLLVDEGDAHERAEDDDAGHRRHPERPPRRDREVVEGVGDASLAQHEEREGDDADDEQSDAPAPACSGP